MYLDNIEDTSIGRTGRLLLSVVWPDNHERNVTVSSYQPYSGERKIALRVQAPEIDYPIEIQSEHLDQTGEMLLIAKKCLIVLARWHLNHTHSSAQEFMWEVKKLCPSGLSQL